MNHLCKIELCSVFITECEKRDAVKRGLRGAAPLLLKFHIVFIDFHNLESSLQLWCRNFSNFQRK
jgi:hypothetical protein